MFQGEAESERVTERPGQLDRFPIELQGLVRMTEVPAGDRQIAALSDAGVFAGDGHPGAGAIAVVIVG